MLARLKRDETIEIRRSDGQTKIDRQCLQCIQRNVSQSYPYEDLVSSSLMHNFLKSYALYFQFPTYNHPTDFLLNYFCGNSPFSTFKGKERSRTCKHGFTSSTSATNLPNHLLHDDDHVGWGWFKCVQLVVVNNVSSIEILSLNLTTNYLYDRNVTPPV